MPSIEDRIREAHRELAELQTADHPARVEAKRQDHVEALHRERAYAAQQLARGRALGERRETIYGGGPLHTSPQTGTEIAAEAERNIEVIDREIARVSA